MNNHFWAICWREGCALYENYDDVIIIYPNRNAARVGLGKLVKCEEVSRNDLYIDKVEITGL